MTEPTQAQIEEAKQMRARYASRHTLNVYTNELASLIAHIRREAKNAALEEAIETCKASAKEWRGMAEGASNGMYDFKADAAEGIANELIALKDQP